MSANQAWQIERNGINVVAEADRAGRPADLFWLWFAANIGILGVVYGAIIESFGQNFWQGLAVAVLGSLSFVLVGLLSVAGRDGGAPMMTLSRAVFGTVGNFLPTAVSWLSLVGWETVMVITGSMACMSLLGPLVHWSTTVLTLLSMLAVAALVVAFGLLGQATLVVVQRWASYVFGTLTLVVAALLVPGTHWRALLDQPPGPWLGGFLPALSIIVAGTGLSWANTAADYSRYLPRRTSAASIVWSTTAGSALPLVGLMAVGMLLATRAPGLATAANPIAAIQAALPPWMAVPYLLATVGGLVAEADLALYSSGLNLLNLGVPLARWQSVFVDACLMLAGTVWVLLLARNFYGPFESFLVLLGVGLAAWTGVFLVHQLGGRQAAAGREARAVRWPAVLAWVAGSGAGLVFTASPLFTGPLARGVFATSSLELAVAGLVGGGLFWLSALLPGRRQGG